ncbi:MAG: C25 family cysteine peptidase [Bacteroidia bacterium]
MIINTAFRVIPTVTSYQSPGSTNNTQTYISDDFFGLLDDNEGNWYNGETVDLAIGRLPVKSGDEANAALNKIQHYVTAPACFRQLEKHDQFCC